MTAGGSAGRWGRAAVWLPGPAVAVGAAVATAHGLFEVAVAARVPVGVAWIYPLITDGVALVAYTATARLSGSAARYAWTVLVVSAGLTGFAQAVYLASDTVTAGGEPEVSAGLRFGVGAWPAIAAAVVVHLLYLLAETPTEQPTDDRIRRRRSHRPGRAAADPRRSQPGRRAGRRTRRPRRPAPADRRRPRLLARPHRPDPGPGRLSKAELSARDADDDPDQQVTAAEWKAAHDAAMAEEDAHRQITEADLAVDDHLDDTRPVRDDSAAGTGWDDVREQVEHEPRPGREDVVRVPDATETTGHLDHAGRILDEIRYRDTGDDLARAEEVTRRHIDDQAAEDDEYSNGW